MSRSTRPMFVETDEQTMLREAVREHRRAATGTRYYLEVLAERAVTATELWDELGRYGFLGVNIPPSTAAQAAGITELAIVCEELAAAGTPSFLLIVSTAICGELLDPARQRGAEARVAAADGDRRGEDGVRRSPSPTPARTRTTSPRRRRATATSTASAARSTTPRRSTRPTAFVVVARTGTDERPAAAGSRSSSSTRRAGLEMHPIEVEMTAPEKQFTLFFDDVDGPGRRA